MNNPVLRFTVLLTGLLGLGLGPAAGLRASTAEEAFQHPPREAAPWVYWVWLQTPTTPAAIARDLEAMKTGGIPGFILYDCGAGNLEPHNRKMVLGDREFKAVPTDDFRGEDATPLPVLAPWSPAWRDEIKQVARESKRLGLDFCLTIGLAGCSAPGLEPQYGEQQLVWSSIELAGPAEADTLLPAPRPEKRPRVPADLAAAYREVAVVAAPAGVPFDPAKARIVSDRMDATGRLHWQVPAGKWRVWRFGQLPTGKKNSWGLFCDHLSTEGFDRNWALTVGPLLQAMTPEERSAMNSVEDDSWEAGDPNWTRLFPEAFRQRRGYDLISSLPILAGAAPANPSAAYQFRRDYAVTISDLEVDNYYGHMRSVCHANGLKLLAEANGPNYHGIDVTQSGLRVDQNMGEFWMPSAHRPTIDSRFLTRDAVTSNHIRGEPVTMCEAFTSVAPLWSESPFAMKACADQAFTDGVNRMCIHNFSHSPLLDAEPGDVYFAGTHVNQHITWWSEAPAFFTYLARCSAVLQQGSFVADALFFIGDGVNEAAPRKKIDPSLGPGYDYDRIDATALGQLAEVKDGRIVLSTGMSYRVLILPDEIKISPAARKTIDGLIAAGATVVGHGTRLTARAAMRRLNVPPDFEFDQLSVHGEIDWIHRSTPDAEIYYVASRWFSPENIWATFRITGRQPELWDPVTGAVADAPAFRQRLGRTDVPLHFGPCGSVFVVFRRAISPTARGLAKSNAPVLTPLLKLDRDWRVTFDPKWGGPTGAVAFPTLMDWTQRPEPGIKYYSGTAIYRARFALRAALNAGQRLMLDLGEVREVARVRLNGLDLGVAWTKPAQVEITAAVRAGENQLEVEVVNLWPNRLIGDAALPEGQQLTRTNLHNYTRSSPLLPSGLLGPVRILQLTAPLANP